MEAKGSEIQERDIINTVKGILLLNYLDEDKTSKHNRKGDEVGMLFTL